MAAPHDTSYEGVQTKPLEEGFAGAVASWQADPDKQRNRRRFEIALLALLLLGFWRGGQTALEDLDPRLRFRTRSRWPIARLEDLVDYLYREEEEAVSISPLASGLTVPQARAVAARAREDAERYAAKLRGERASAIADTETVTAIAHGRLEAWRNAAAAGLIPLQARRMWVTSGDDRVCGDCRDMDGQTVGLDEPFYSRTTGITLWAPSLHPGDRCHIELV